MGGVNGFHLAFSLAPLLLGGLTLTVLVLQWKAYSAFAHWCFVGFVWAFTAQAVLGVATLVSVASDAGISGGLWVHLGLATVATATLHAYQAFEKKPEPARFYFALFSTLGSLLLVGVSLSALR